MYDKIINTTKVLNVTHYGVEDTTVSPCDAADGSRSMLPTSESLEVSQPKRTPEELYKLSHRCQNASFGSALRQLHDSYRKSKQLLDTPPASAMIASKRPVPGLTSSTGITQASSESKHNPVPGVQGSGIVAHHATVPGYTVQANDRTVKAVLVMPCQREEARSRLRPASASPHLDSQTREGRQPTLAARHH